MKTLEIKNIIRKPYAWPGGYPLYFVTVDCSALCVKCARSEYRQIARAAKYPGTDKQWEIFGAEINWESEIYCEHCSKQIESAYGPNESQEISNAEH